jgi:hypothetical protein
MLILLVCTQIKFNLYSIDTYTFNPLKNPSISNYRFKIIINLQININEITLNHNSINFNTTFMSNRNPSFSL